MPASKLRRSAFVLLVLGMAVANDVLASPEKAPCHNRARVGSCALHCRWSTRLCRLCCRTSTGSDGGDGEDGTTEGKTEPTTTTSVGEGNKEDEKDAVKFPNKLPEGTQEAMLETAAHILAIVSREDPERIRIWVENPERNLDNLDRLAAKLASFPRAPFGRAYWRLVLSASKDRPFTLLREALAVRAAYQAAHEGAPTTPTTAVEEA